MLDRGIESGRRGLILNQGGGEDGSGKMGG